MKKSIFKENLLKVLDEISVTMNTKLNRDYKFIVVPVQEEGKSYNSKDDVMRLWLFSDSNIKGKYFDIDSVVDLFSGLEPLYPLWINVSVKENHDEIKTIELQTSLRFRKPSELQNQDTGHAPFKAV
jgi:hypothetical protein